MKVLKKILPILGIGIFLSFILILLLWCVAMVTALMSQYDYVQSDDGFDYLIRYPIKKAAVGGYMYDPKSGNDTIDIPEYYGKYPINGMGYTAGPFPFQIDIKNVHVTAGVFPHDGSFDWYTKDRNLEFVYYDLVLNIGPNIRKIYAAQDGLRSVNKLYVPRVYVNCDPDNPNYYSEDGILYQKKDGKVVDGFLYWNQY